MSTFPAKVADKSLANVKDVDAAFLNIIFALVPLLLSSTLIVILSSLVNNLAVESNLKSPPPTFTSPAKVALSPEIAIGASVSVSLSDHITTSLAVPLPSTAPVAFIVTV